MPYHWDAYSNVWDAADDGWGNESDEDMVWLENGSNEDTVATTKEGSGSNGNEVSNTREGADNIVYLSMCFVYWRVLRSQ